MHLGQPRGEAGPRPEEPEEPIALPPRRQELPGRTAPGFLLALDERQRIVRHRHALIDRRLERREPRRRVAGGGNRVREADAVGCQQQALPQRARRHRRSRRARGPPDPGQGLGHGPRVPEVLAHQRLDPWLRLGARIAEPPGDLLLERLGQHVQVLPGRQVQDGADPKEEFLGGLQALGDRGPVPVLGDSGEPRDRAARPDVPQGARRVLHVGLDLKARVVEAGVALVGQDQQRIQNLRVRVRARVAEPRLEPLDEAAVAGQDPHIQQRQQELRIVRVEALEFRQFPHVVSHRQLEVPQRVQQRRQEALLAAPDPPAEEHQQVEVGVQAELPPAVPAQRADRNRFVDVPPRSPDDPGQQVVGPVREARQRVSSAAAGLDLRDELRARRAQRWRQPLAALGCVAVAALSRGHRSPAVTSTPSTGPGPP